MQQNTHTMTTQNNNDTQKPRYSSTNHHNNTNYHNIEGKPENKRVGRIHKDKITHITTQHPHQLIQIKTKPQTTRNHTKKHIQARTQEYIQIQPKHHTTTYQQQTIVNP